MFKVGDKVTPIMDLVSPSWCDSILKGEIVIISEVVGNSLFV